MSNKPKITIRIAEQDYEFSQIENKDGTIKAIDVCDFYQKTNYLLYDTYLNNISFTKTHISHSGPNQILYRGYDLVDLVKKSTFIEVAYLLIQRRLPNQNEFDTYSDALTKHSLIHEDMHRFFDSFAPNTNPLGVLATLVTGLYDYLSAQKTNTTSIKYNNQNDNHDIDIKYQLLSKVRTLAAWAYKKSCGHATIYPQHELPYCANLLHMMFATPAETITIDDAADHLLNQLLILSAEHNENVSTATVRLLAASGTNMFVSINAGISALWGKRDSFSQIMPMLRYMLKSKKSPQKLISELLKQEKETSEKTPSIMNVVQYPKSQQTDVRARIAAGLFHNLCQQPASLNNRLGALLTGSSDPLIEKSLELEAFMLQDGYCQDHGIYPNLDFYSALLNYQLHIPDRMFNVIGAIGKIAGWLAHWQEQSLILNQSSSPVQSIQSHPLYTGSNKREFVSLQHRG